MLEFNNENKKWFEGLEEGTSKDTKAAQERLIASTMKDIPWSNQDMEELKNIVLKLVAMKIHNNAFNPDKRVLSTPILKLIKRKVDQYGSDKKPKMHPADPKNKSGKTGPPVDRRADIEDTPVVRPGTGPTPMYRRGSIL